MAIKAITDKAKGIKDITGMVKLMPTINMATAIMETEGIQEGITITTITAGTTGVHTMDTMEEHIMQAAVIASGCRQGGYTGHVEQEFGLPVTGPITKASLLLRLIKSLGCECSQGF